MDNLQRDRFTGFAEQYDRHRPPAPMETLLPLIRLYLGAAPRSILDVGCGTGLSTLAWAPHATKVIGVEPNADMIAVARRNAADTGSENVTFIEAESVCLPVVDDSVDLVTCSQSFHWMDPEPSLAEFARVLQPGGVVAVYDCDWPPSVGEAFELRFTRIVDQARAVLRGNGTDAKQWPKSGHLDHMQTCGHFRFAREVCFHAWADFDAPRLIGLIETQGAVQQALRGGDSALARLLGDESDAIRTEIGPRTVHGLFVYRMRVAVK